MLKKNDTAFLYIIWGGVSTILNIALYRLFLFCKIDYQIANFITLVIVKIFTYVTNKLFVFRTSYANFRYFLKEICSFFLMRGMTFIVDFAGVMVMVEFLGWDAFFSKCIVAIGVIGLNYILSSRFVFRKRERIGSGKD